MSRNRGLLEHAETGKFQRKLKVNHLFHCICLILARVALVCCVCSELMIMGLVLAPHRIAMGSGTQQPLLR